MQAFWTELGHVLVQPQVNGQPAGWFILDTGASGLVIERDAADRLGLSSFGEVYVAGVGRKVRILTPTPGTERSCKSEPNHAQNRKAIHAIVQCRPYTAFTRLW